MGGNPRPPWKGSVLRPRERGWRIWLGVNRRFYARLLGSSPPVVVRAARLAALGPLMRQAEEERRAR